MHANAGRTYNQQLPSTVVQTYACSAKLVSSHCKLLFQGPVGHTRLEYGWILDSVRQTPVCSPACLCLCARLITLISVELESRGGGGYNQRVWIGRSFVRSLG